MRSPSDLYISLRLADGHCIRVLDLLPGTRNEEVRITLRVVDLRSRPPYEALSYAWGKSTGGHVVRVNTFYEILVTDNLFRALKALRLRFGVRTMWVDAIAINQLDLVERNEEVKIMGTIFAKASCVNVWLGERAKGSKAWKYPRALFGMILRDGLAINDALGSSEFRWYDRAWTIQEFLLARRVFLCFGKRRIQYRPDVVRLTASMNRQTPELDFFARILADRLDFAQKAMSSRKHNSAQKKLTLLQAANALGWVQASDPRDMVYSMLGLINASEASYIDVDYTCSCQRVYAKATLASFRSSGTFDMLHFVGIEDHPAQRRNLPSWCANFARLPYRKFRIVPDGNPPLLGHDVGYAARLRELGLECAKPRADASFRTLEFGALRFDRICETMSLDLSDSEVDVVQAQREELDRFVERAATISTKVIESPDAGETFGARMLRRLVSSFYGSHVDSGLSVSRGDSIFSNNKPEDLRLSHEGSLLAKTTNCQALEQWTRFTWPSIPDDSRTWPINLQAKSELVGTYFKYARSMKNEDIIMFRTEAGLLGLAPASIDTGHHVVMVDSPWPFIILEHDTRFRGLAYVHGFMHRSLWDRWNGEAFQLHWHSLV